MSDYFDAKMDTSIKCLSCLLATAPEKIRVPAALLVGYSGKDPRAVVEQACQAHRPVLEAFVGPDKIALAKIAALGLPGVKEAIVAELERRDAAKANEN